MASVLGLAITKLTSKAGILSKKASVRLATETGEKILAKKNELGRNLNTAELEQIFAEVLPKRCIPKIITTDNEVRKCLKSDGLSDEQISSLLITCKSLYMVAANVTNGTKKLPIYMPKDVSSWIPAELKPYLNITFPANVAHEVEHSLEKNCRVFEILKRKTANIRRFFERLYDKNYMEKINDREVGIHEFEADLQRTFRPIVSVTSAGIMKLKCKPTVEGISESIGGSENVIEKLRKIMNEYYANSSDKSLETIRRLNYMKYWMDMECSAYNVTGNIERKIFNLKDGEYAAGTGVAKGYDIAKEISKKEIRAYLKNKFFGWLKN